MLVSDIEWQFTKQNKKALTINLRMWKLKDQDVVCKFQDELNNLLESNVNLILEFVENKWKHIKINLLKDTEVSRGLSKNGKWRNHTWWWDSSVNEAAKEKRRLWKIWKKWWQPGRLHLAKRVAKQRVFAAKLKKKGWKILKLIHISSTHIIYQRAKQIKQENKDIIAKKCIRDDNGLLAFNEEDKNKACR